MTPTIRHLAEFDGWIFSKSGSSVQKGKNGTNRRLSDLHYDRWEWLFPVYEKLCVRFAGDERLKNIQSAILLGDNEMVGELCGRLVKAINYENQNCTARLPGTNGGV